MHRLSVVSMTLLLVLAGCGGSLGPGTDEPTATPDSRTSPTATDPDGQTPASSLPLPPGVTPGADDEVDERTLYVAHGEALAERSVTWRQVLLRVNATGTVIEWRTRTVWTNGSRQRYDIETGGPVRGELRSQGFEYDFWTNGSVTVSRQAYPDGRVERRVTEGGPRGSFGEVGAGRVVLEGLLAGRELQYVGVERRNGTVQHVLSWTAGASRLTLYVTPAGVVRSVVWRESASGVTFLGRFRVSDVGSTTVERPPWAENATAP